MLLLSQNQSENTAEYLRRVAGETINLKDKIKDEEIGLLKDWQNKPVTIQQGKKDLNFPNLD